MICPNCETPTKLKTIETFNTERITYRTKKCSCCNYLFTSHEVLSDEQTIPGWARKVNRKPKDELPETTNGH